MPDDAGPELTAAMAETRRVLALLAELLDGIRRSGVNNPYLERKAASVRQRAGLTA